MEALITISLKEGIGDPEGANTKKALNLLGYDRVKEVRALKAFKITFEGSEDYDREIDEMCRKLLTNPVIHDYKVDLL